METFAPIGSRNEFPIPAKFVGSAAKPNVKEVEATAKIQHHLLQILHRGGGIQFSLLEIKPDPGPTNIRAYAQAVAFNKTYEQSPKFPGFSNIDRETLKFLLEQFKSPEKLLGASPQALGSVLENFKLTPADTPYDIETKGGHQRWVVLELEDGYNWRFAPGGPGVATEIDNSAQAPSENHGLCFVTKNSVHGPDLPAGEPYLKVPAKGDPTKPEDWECKVLFWAVSHRPDEDMRKFNFYIEFHQTSEQKPRTLPLIFDPNVPNDGGGSIIPP